MSALLHSRPSKDILAQLNTSPYDDKFFAVYKMWDNIHTMLSYGSSLLDVSDVLYFEAIAWDRNDDFIQSLEGVGRPDVLPAYAQVAREMYDIVDRSHRSFFFAMKTAMDITHFPLNESGLVDSYSDAVSIFEHVKLENAKEGEMIRPSKSA